MNVNYLCLLLHITRAKIMNRQLHPRQITCHEAPKCALSTRHGNYCDMLNVEDDYFDDKCITVDSGATANFGRTSTPGTNWRQTDRGITMISATGDHEHIVGLDYFDIALPADAAECHALDKKGLQRPLLSVGEACDAGCCVTFDHATCSFCKDGEELLWAPRDPRTRLWLPPRHKTTDNINTCLNQQRCKPRDDFHM